jgi:protocadherin Fat 1/2/3
VIVDVEVIDINDNAPMFVNQPYYAILSKDTEKDATVLKVTAIDRDKGNNGDIYYQLVRGQGDLFRVGRKTGLITLRTALDSYEKEYKLTVAAYDGGTPPFSEEVLVVVKMVDKSVPVFGQQLYRTTVKEDVQPFSPLVTTTAESPNKSEQKDGDGKLIYTIESGNESEKFSIDYSSGVVSVTDSLDFEEKAHHQVMFPIELQHVYKTEVICANKQFL